MNNTYNTLGDNPVGQGIGDGRCNGLNSYLDAKDALESYNAKMSDAISCAESMHKAQSDFGDRLIAEHERLKKPKVKFYSDGGMFFFNKNKCSEYEFFGWIWTRGLMNDSKYKMWCEHEKT